MKKEFIKESIEHYRELIKFYDEMIAEDTKRWMDPRTSDKKRHAYKELVKVMEREKRKCQKGIERLLNE